MASTWVNRQRRVHCYQKVYYDVKREDRERTMFSYINCLSVEDSTLLMAIDDPERVREFASINQKFRDHAQ